MANSDGRALRLPTQIAYGAGQIAAQTFRDVPSLLLLFFMTNVLGIAPAVAGSAIFFPKLAGGILFDATAGVLSDRWLTRFKRRNWLIGGIIAAPAAMIALFHVPAGSAALQTGYVAVIFTFYMAVFASFSVPYLAVAADLALTSRARTMLMAWRMVFISVGVLIAGAVAPAYVQQQGGGQAGYEAMALLLGVICSAALAIAWFGARRAEAEVGYAQREADPPLTLSSAAKAIAEPRFALLAGVTVLQLMGAGMAYAALLYFLTYNMASANPYGDIGIVVLLASAGIILGQPLWVAASARIGRKAVYIIAALLHAAANVGWGLSTTIGVEAIYGFALLLGIGNSGWALMGHSIAVDIAGEGRTGIYTSSWMAIDKIGFALGGTFALGLILSAYGFDASLAAQGLAQSSSAYMGVFVGFAVIPALTNVIAAAVIALWGRNFH